MFDALQNKAHAIARLVLGVYTEGIVDVALAVTHGAHDLTAEIKAGQGLGQSFFRFAQCHNAYSSHRLSGYRPAAVLSAMAFTTTGLSSL